MDRDRKPDWKYWNAYDLLEVWQAVALSIGRDPASITDHRDRRTSGHESGPIRLFDGGAEFNRRLDVLESAFDLHPAQFVRPNDPYFAFGVFVETRVFPEKVRDFFVSRGFDVPPEWRSMRSQSPEQPVTNGSQTNSGAASGRWPWGSYETELLRCLDAAARRYWVNYDPADPTTASTNDVVTDWLRKEFKLSQNKAQAIVTILRADDLPAGPRR